LNQNEDKLRVKVQGKYMGFAFLNWFALKKAEEIFKFDKLPTYIVSPKIYEIIKALVIYYDLENPPP
jgi:hypothetical protein